MFNRFLLPQRGQKCIVSQFAENSFDGVANPVITSNPAFAHAGGRIRFREASHSSRIGGFAAAPKLLRSGPIGKHKRVFVRTHLA
jgi:hypothetical protein